MDRIDLRLLPAAAAAWVAAWLAPTLHRTTVGIGVLGAGVAALLLARSRTAGATVLAAALGVGAAAGLGAAARGTAIAAGPVDDLAHERATVRVDLRVTGDPAVRATASRFGRSEVITVPALVERVLARGTTTDVHTRVLVLATDRGWTNLIPGQEMRVAGRLSPPRSHSPLAAILQVRGPPPVASAAPWRDRAAADVRAGLRSAVAGLGAAERGLVPGLVLGDTSGIDPELSGDFQVAGLSHVLAVSGSNLALLLGAVLGLARLAGVRLRALPVVGLATVVVFVFVARPEPSLLRASVMGVVGVLGLAVGRRGRAAPALCAAVIVLLLVDPWLARSYGFALSVSATAGLIFLAPRWRDRLARRMPRWLATAIAVPAAAQAACGPVLVLLTDEVALVAVPANLLAVPAVPPAMLLGVLAAVTWPVCPPLARVFGQLAGLPAWWIVTVARCAADVPGATVPWLAGARGALVLTLLTLAVVTVRQLPPVAVGLVVLAVVLALRPPVPVPSVLPSSWPPRDWVVVACDVGQGDALAIRAGPRSAVVVDAGPDPAAVDRCLRRLGVREIPYLLLTHFHADHVEGLPGVLRGRRVAEIGVSPLPDPAGEVERVQRWAGRIPLTSPGPGEQRRAGDVAWRVLWPLRLIDEGAPANNASVVLLAEVRGVRILLTGDIEPAAQAALHRAEPGLRADVLKVPHHGSAHQHPPFLATLGARIALASVGADNDYGHPAPAVLRLLTAARTAIGRTDRHGDVAVVLRAGRLAVVRDRPG
ncbi:ComEC/Rec2 family competence protein [Sporichthya brevicatena]|uniref:ComEC/Rec2 family competence protein n=1 Tax=Sporichthya brevicatena TaxID=171442 RepID=A0ABP3S8Z4_9ACTN